MCTPETKGKEEGSNERRGGCWGEDCVMPSACSLGNLSNLESCQDTARLCKALPFPLPCVSTLVYEWVRRRKSRSKKAIERSWETGCQCLMLFVLIQGKLMLCVDRTSCCPPRGFGSGGFASSSLLSHNRLNTWPLVFSIAVSQRQSPFSVSDMYWQLWHS